MITDIINLVDGYHNLVNFICYITIFCGGFYVALHSRLLPRWASTCIWYIGLSSFFTASTIVIEWTLGQHHPLSHFMMGHIGEMVMNLNLMIMVLLLFFHTVYQDFKNKRKRELKVQEERLTI